MRILCTLILCALPLFFACDNAFFTIDDERTQAYEAIKKHDWRAAKQILESYLRYEEDFEKRWEAWRNLFHVTIKIGSSPHTRLFYLENMYQEFEEDGAKKKVILYDIGLLQEELRNFDYAEDIWTMYLDSENISEQETFFGHRKLAYIYYKKGYFDSVENVLSSCLSLNIQDNDHAVCMYDLADLKATKKEFDDAKILIEEILAMENIDIAMQGQAAFLLGDILEEQKDFTKALEFFERARLSYPNTLAVKKRIDYLKKQMKSK